MGGLIHKFGLELDLTSSEARHPNHKNGLEAKILKKEGIFYAEFSKEHSDIIVVEYDPSITTPGTIYESIKHENGDIKRKIFL
jgi:hypothetical protein